MAIGKKITQLNVEAEENVTNNTLIYIVNNGESRQIPLEDLIFDGFITALKIGDNAIVSGKIKSQAIETKHLKANTITADKIQAGLITADMLKITGSGAVTPTSIGAAEATAFGNALTDISNLQGQVGTLEESINDGGINTFYQATQPTNPDIGDLWFDTADNKLYRWNGAAWSVITDPDILTAITNAANAASIADRKITTYYNDNQPTVDLIDGSALDADDEGDLWFDTNDGNNLYRWSGTEWVEVSDNRVSTLATQMADAITNITDIGNTVSTLQAAEDGGINTFYQTGQPTGGGLGDLWIDTDDGNKLYRFDGTSWLEIQDAAIQTAITNAADAAATADKKITTYYGNEAPSVDLVDGTPLDADDTGDLWFETDEDNRLHRWDGSQWVEVTDGRVSTLSNNLGTAVTNITTLEARADGFVHTFFQPNKPTNIDVSNGALQVGDLWIDTDNGNKLFRYDGGDFTEVQDTAIQTAIADAASAANIADNKITTYYGNRSPMVDSIDGLALGAEDTGDLWFESDNNNKLHRWSGTAWVAVADGRVDSLLTDLGNAVSDITTLQGINDGFVHTFYQSTVPANSDLPAGSIGVGDLWIDTGNNNTLKRYNGTSWQSVSDQNIATAIADAAAAANTADGKITTYYGNTAPTTDSVDGTALGADDTGDLWFESSNDNKLHRWNGSSWVAVADSRIDTLLTNLATAVDDITSLQDKADGLVTTFYQTNAPNEATGRSEGDLWIDSNGGNKLYLFRNGSWQAIQDTAIATAIADAASAANIADGKIKTFYQTSAPGAAASDAGDLWFDTNANMKLYRYNGSSWQTVQDTSISSNIYTSGTTTIDGGKITTGSIKANKIETNSLDANYIKIDGITIDSDGSGNLIVGNFEGTSHLNSGSVGFIGGISGVNSADSNQDISSSEIVRGIYGDNGYPKHIAGEASTVANPDIALGDVLGDQTGATPLYRVAFTTGNYSGTKPYIIQGGIDILGSSSSSTESNFAMAMRQTTSATNFRSTSNSHYVFTTRISSVGSHSLGIHMLTEQVNLPGNKTYQVWCFAHGDDGVSGYKSGYINVFGLFV